MATGSSRQREEGNIAVPERTRGGPFTEGGAAGRDDDPSVEVARRLYDMRRRGAELLGRDFFTEPAWDLLLYMFVATSRSGAICVSDACYGAAAPETTALRRIRVLEAAGLIHREGDPSDARRSYVRLSPRAMRIIRILVNHGAGEATLPARRVRRK